jgi:hypothetical protein
MTGAEVLPLWLPTRSTAFTTSMPLTTRPNTTCLPSSHAAQPDGVSGAGAQ